MSSKEEILKSVKPGNMGFSQSVLQVIYKAMELYASGSGARWVLFSEKFPDTTEHWLATSRYQPGKTVKFKINDLTGLGHLYREQGRFAFEYSAIIQKLHPTTNHTYYSYISGEFTYEEIHKAEWLDESESPRITDDQEALWKGAISCIDNVGSSAAIKQLLSNYILIRNK